MNLDYKLVDNMLSLAILKLMGNSILEGIKAVSFDFWYTIGRYETEAEWGRQDEIRVKEFKQILAERGVEISESQIERTLQDVGAECEAERLKTEMEISSREVVSRFLTRSGIRKRIAGGLSELLRSFDEALLKVKIVAEPQAIEVLAELKRRGYSLALLSNTSHGHIIKRIMDREALTGFFDHLLYTDEIGTRKPNPEAFKILLDRLGTRPEETVHVGDRIDLDVLGARRSDLRSVLYAPGGDCCQDGLPRPDFCIHTLGELIED
jgi:putative hydrolase of the HAD superfamily